MLQWERCLSKGMDIPLTFPYYLTSHSQCLSLVHWLTHVVGEKRLTEIKKLIRTVIVVQTFIDSDLEVKSSQRTHRGYAYINGKISPNQFVNYLQENEMDDLVLLTSSRSKAMLCCPDFKESILDIFIQRFVQESESTQYSCEYIVWPSYFLTQQN